jgi:DNA-binding transcriptional ArsR family regulator
MGATKAKNGKPTTGQARPSIKRASPVPSREKGVATGPRLPNGIVQASTILKMVADPVRLAILLTLAQGEQGVGELSDHLECSHPATSHHLALLRVSGLIASRRSGKQSYYSLTQHGSEVANILLPLQNGTYHSPPTPLVREITTPIDPKLLRDVAGFVDDPERWFHTPNRELGWQKPIEMLGTDEEPKLRNRIEGAKYGMFS